MNGSDLSLRKNKMMESHYRRFIYREGTPIKQLLSK